MIKINKKNRIKLKKKIIKYKVKHNQSINNKIKIIINKTKIKNWIWMILIKYQWNNKNHKNHRYNRYNRYNKYGVDNRRLNKHVHKHKHKDNYNYKIKTINYVLWVKSYHIIYTQQI